MVQQADCENQKPIPCNGQQGIQWGIGSGLALCVYLFSKTRFFKSHRISSGLHAFAFFIVAVLVWFSLYFHTIFEAFGVQVLYTQVLYGSASHQATTCGVIGFGVALMSILALVVNEIQFHDTLATVSATFFHLVLSPRLCNPLLLFHYYYFFYF